MRRQKLILGVCSDPNAAAFLQLLHNWWSNELTESQNLNSISISKRWQVNKNKFRN